MEKTWHLIHELLYKNRSKFDIPSVFMNDGKIYSGAIDISNGLTTFLPMLVHLHQTT